MKKAKILNLNYIKKCVVSTSTIILVLLGLYVPNVTAEELIITGNGSDSVNTVDSISTQQNVVTQNNELDVTNNITANSNTGDNTANDNTGGDTSIDTGDIATDIDVANTGNVSVVNVGNNCDCPPESSNSIISENGAESNNNITNQNTNNTYVNVDQVASINNNILVDSNTGDNTANRNNGDVQIKTGDIFTRIKLLNGPLNISKVKVSSGSSIELMLKIAGNGVSSINTINNTEINNIIVNENNLANIINDVVSKLNTGGNDASKNNGDVAIKTGDISTTVSISNLANLNEVVIDCGCKEKPGEEKPPILPPGITTTPPTSVSGGGAPASSPAVQGVAQEMKAALSAILPSTGGNWLLFSLLGNIMMFFLGAYLRLRSGRSPGFVPSI
jgi:hypothetical protein